MIDFKAIGRRIKTYRKLSCLTQWELAEKLDVTDKYISQIECGTAEVSLKRLDEIAALIDTEIQYLITDANDSSPNFLNSEVYENIKDFNPGQKRLLIDMINVIKHY